MISLLLADQKQEQFRSTSFITIRLYINNDGMFLNITKFVRIFIQIGSEVCDQ